MKGKWAGTTYGSRWMHTGLVGMLRWVDVRVIYVVAALFVVPVVLCAGRSRKTTYRYLRRRIGMGRARAAWMTYVNHCLFAQVVIDRFAMYAGKRFRLQTVGYEHFLRAAAAEKGFVQLSAHVGNYEVAGYTIVAETKAMHALVFAGEKATVMAGRDKLFARTNIRMIAVREDMSHLFEINNALAEGEIVSMPADRFVASQKSLTTDFLGAKAEFPQGPFALPTARGMEVLAVNVVKTSTTGYTAYVTPLDYDRTQPRRRQTEQLMQAYVRELERVVRLYPTQWYNYYDFWDDEP